jgi:hypothetical protein
MFYCGFDPYTGKSIYIARGIEEKRRQKDFFFWYKNHPVQYKPTKIRR